MKRVEAVIKPERFDWLKINLEGIPYPGLMVTEIEGHGKQKGEVRQWRGRQYKVDLLPKLKVEIVVPDKDVKKIVNLIIETCRSGGVGDGKIFISEVENAIRIRTSEEGDAALI